VGTAAAEVGPATYFRDLGLRANSLTLDLAPGGLASAQIALLGQNQAVAAASIDDTPGTLGVYQRFGGVNATIEREGVALGNVVSAQITFSNNLDPVRVIRPDALVEDLALGLVSCSGSLVARLRDDTLLGDGGGAPIELVWRWSRSATESVVFTAGRVFLPKTKHAVSGPAAIEATYSWQAAKDGGGTGATLQVVVTNDVASY